MTRTDRENGTVLTALMLVILVTLSCSKGYNKYADECYAKARFFIEIWTMTDLSIVSRRCWNWHRLERITTESTICEVDLIEEQTV